MSPCGRKTSSEGEIKEAVKDSKTFNLAHQTICGLHFFYDFASVLPKSCNLLFVLYDYT